MSDAYTDLCLELNAAWTERFDGLVGVLGEVLALQHELLEALDELQQDFAALSAVEPHDGRLEAAAAVRAQARQSRLHAGHLRERAAELVSGAEVQRSDAASLLSRGAAARPESV